jgi:hypothetical protein
MPSSGISIALAGYHWNKRRRKKLWLAIRSRKP